MRALSTDDARTYKPDPRAYGLAVDAFRAHRSEILFVAFAGWDWLDMQGVREVTSFAELVLA